MENLINQPATRAFVPGKGVALTQAQIKEFYERGYTLIRGLFSPEEVADAARSFERLQKTAITLKKTEVINGSQFVVENGRIDRIVWMGAAEPELLKFGEDPRLLLPCSQILDVTEFDQLICQGHYKLPGDTVMFDWHQDCQHRGVGTPDWVDVDGRGSFVQTLMAIDEVAEDNGPVVFIPTPYTRGYVGLDKSNNPTSLFDVKQGIPLLLQPGDVAFFGPYSIHGSWPNNSQRSRRVFINGFATPGANRRQYPGDGSGRRVKLFPNL